MKNNNINTKSELPLAMKLSDLKAPPKPDIKIIKSNNTCVINIAYPYEIDLDRIKTERDLLSWVHQLTEKVWMDNHALREFIEQVAKEKGFNVYGC